MPAEDLSDAVAPGGAVRVLDAPGTQKALSDSAALTAALSRALVAVARGEASVPPRIAARATAGLLGAMPGYVPGLGLAAKLITVFADPARPGRSTHRGVVVVFDERDGRPLAVLDAEPLTAIRTAATSILAFRALARPDARRVTVVGTGTLAAAHLAQLAGDPDLSVTVAGRDPDRVRALSERFGVAGAASIESAVRAADAVLCCTGAHEPVVLGEWLAPGTHISSVGGSQGPELDAATIAGAALFAEWDGAVAAAPPAGAHELQGVDPGRVTLLGAVLDGAHPGRGALGAPQAELTVFKSTGHAALDVAAASVAVAALAV
ncbi:ornithine cyclodeaminase family protein [Actinospica sp. MGRD01-02]|uniref:Ornithine cyclodeaminase family protein n=1 Tax=Actinospica acidithermotolerans TaxID=2828514 RepID=A0A941IJU3_9ACTN|nr:NAD(P)-binding domain-containing protein [Actinospica acidithermotolerans]MBR7831135.1 ornithine cyclodeaminase family protein [Actinospica acidithermotolerans]